MTDNYKDEITGGEDNGHDEEKKDPMRFCTLCRRPESQTGKLIDLPNNIHICSDCMQKSFDSVNQQISRGGFNYSDLFNMPGVSMIDLGSLQNQMAQPRKAPQKKKAEEKKPALDLKKIPAPHKIKASLDEYVIGQEYAKKVMSVAVYNHYKRVATDTMDEIEIEKSNMLMIGPTGCGKTYLVRTLARLLDVPLAIADATSLTEAGYIGDDIESVVSKLLAAADNDIEKAEHGIIFIDEIDKIAKKKNTNQRDVSGEAVQQGLLKLLEGSEVEVPVGAGSKNAMVPLVTVNTRNILFICGGAFDGLESIISARTGKKNMGFGADIKTKDEISLTDTFKKVLPEDLMKFGLIPEFAGRLPVVVTLEALDKAALIKILQEPKNALVKQYQHFLAMDNVELEFEPDALDAIAEEALKRSAGARGLRAIIEAVMRNVMYDVPSRSDVVKCIVTADSIRNHAEPKMIVAAG